MADPEIPEAAWPYSLPRAHAEALRDEGARLGHKVMVTPVGPRYVLDCTCGDPWGRRYADPLPATEAALAHLQKVVGGELTAAGTPALHDGRQARDSLEALHRSGGGANG